MTSAPASLEPPGRERDRRNGRHPGPAAPPGRGRALCAAGSRFTDADTEAAAARCSVVISGIRDPPPHSSPIQREGRPGAFWGPDPLPACLPRSSAAGGLGGALAPAGRSGAQATSVRTVGLPPTPAAAVARGARAARRGVPIGGCLCAEASGKGLKIAWAEMQAIFSLGGGPSQFPRSAALGPGRRVGGCRDPLSRVPTPPGRARHPDPGVSAQPAPGEGSWADRA